VKGASFTIEVDVAYSYQGSLQTRVAVYEGTETQTGDLLSTSSTMTLTGTGSQEFTVSLKAPNTPKTWHLEALAERYLTNGPKGPGWYYLTQGGYKEFTIAVLQEAEWPTITGLQADQERALINTSIRLQATISYEFTVPTKISVRAYSGRISDHTPTTNEDMRLARQDTTLSGKGSQNFQLDVKAGSAPATWHLTVIAMIDGNPDTGAQGWWFNPDLGAKELSVNVVDKVLLTIKTGVENLRVRIDNLDLTADSHGDLQTEISAGPHSVHILQSAAMSGLLGFLGARYVFYGWSGEVTSTNPVLTLTPTSAKEIVLTAEYKADYGPATQNFAIIAGTVVAFSIVLFATRRRGKRTVVVPAVQLGVGKRHCINCGREIMADAIYCPHCAPGLAKPPEIELQAVQATLSVKQLEVKVGETVSLDLEIINTSEKGPVTLVRISDICPPGFRVASDPQPFRVMNDNIDLRGKRLDPLKGAEVALKLVPTNRGVFMLSPRVLYLDEKGILKVSQVPTTTILVKEMGLAEWMKGGRQ